MVFSSFPGACCSKAALPGPSPERTSAVRCRLWARGGQMWAIGSRPLAHGGSSHPESFHTAMVRLVCSHERRFPSLLLEPKYFPASRCTRAKSACSDSHPLPSPLHPDSLQRKPTCNCQAGAGKSLVTEAGLQGVSWSYSATTKPKTSSASRTESVWSNLKRY